MKTNKKSLLSVLALVMLFSCTRAPEHLVSEKPVAPIKDLASEKIKNSTVRVVGWCGIKISIGSGFFVARDKIVTNIHTVAHPGPIFAKLVNNETVWAVESVVAYDVENDLVILKISGAGTPLPLGDSDAVRQGDPISAVGFPNGVYKVRHGRVINTRHNDKKIRSTANTRGGSSGGPVLNRKGQVIGIHTGRNGAIPSNTLKTLLLKPPRTEPVTQWHNRKPIRTYAYFVLGKTKVEDKNYGDAVVDLNKALQLNPKFSYAYYARGVAKSALGDYSSAIADYDKYIQSNFEDAEAYRAQATAKFKLGDSKTEQGYTEEARSLYKAATEDYASAIRLNPNRHHVYNYSAWRKYLFGQFEADEGNTAEARKLYQEAIGDSDKAIQQDPNNLSAYHTRAIAKIALGNIKEAVNDFTTLIRINPGFAKYYYERAQAKESLGQKEAAKADFEKAKELDPNVGQR